MQVKRENTLECNIFELNNAKTSVKFYEIISKSIAGKVIDVARPKNYGNKAAFGTHPYW